MSKRRRTARRKLFSSHVTVFVIFGFIAVIIGIGMFYRITVLRKSVTPNPKQFMQKIPSTTRKELLQNQASSQLQAPIRIPILLYHYVEYVQDKKDTIRQSLTISPNTFEDQVKTLQNAGYTFMTAREVGNVLDGTMQLPKNPIVLTFDDGHWDLATVILPILEKYHIKATAYIISQFIGGSDFMTSQQLQEVIHSNLVEIGAHTLHHYALRGLPSYIVQDEVVQSKKELEQAYQIHIDSFAYPDGSFDQQAINAVKKAGYTTAVSTIPGIQQSQYNRFFLYRIRPGYRTDKTLLTYLKQNTYQAF